MRSDKQPKIKAGPKKSSKEPRKRTDPGNYDKLAPLWSFQTIDMEGRWGWYNIERGKLIEVVNKLGVIERRTWAEIKSNGDSHNCSCKGFIREARQRLEKINQDDVDELFSLYLSAKERVWGILDGQALQILWWDPKHEVYPCPKKHT